MDVIGFSEITELGLNQLIECTIIVSPFIIIKHAPLQTELCFLAFTNRTHTIFPHNNIHILCCFDFTTYFHNATNGKQIPKKDNNCSYWNL